MTHVGKALQCWWEKQNCVHEALGATDEALGPDTVSCFSSFNRWSSFGFLTSLGIRIHPSHWFLLCCCSEFSPRSKSPNNPGKSGRQKGRMHSHIPLYSFAVFFQVVVLKSGYALKTSTVLKPQFNCWLQMLLLIQAKLLSQAEVLTDKSSWNSKEEEISIKIAFVENLKQNVHFSVKAFAS